jgi:predicted esterase
MFLRRTALVVLLLPFVAGCPVTAPQPVDSPIQEMRLPEGGAKYYFFVPSTYRRDRPYPLVIACHGTNPWDSAYAQIREWAHFAEQNDLIVAAPILVGTRGDLRPSAAEQINRQRADEKTILRLVDQIKASRNIAEEQVFLVGWSAGSFAVLHTGLRNPDVFRALAVRQGNFEPSYMDVPGERMDRWQAVFVYFGRTDPWRDESLACIEWLREHNLYVEQRELPGAHRRVEVKVAWDFFKRVIRHRPWVRLRTAKPDISNRRLVWFWCDAKPPMKRVRWDFGDGSGSTDESPKHVYSAPGRYEVTCDVTLATGKTYRRRTTVQIGPPATRQ